MDGGTQNNRFSPQSQEGGLRFLYNRVNLLGLFVKGLKLYLDLGTWILIDPRLLVMFTKILTLKALPKIEYNSCHLMRLLRQ